MDCSPPGPSVHGISQAEILEHVTISFSRASSQPRDRTWVSCIAGRFFTTEPPGKPSFLVGHHSLGKLDLRLWNVCLTLKVPGSQEAGSALQNIMICAHILASIHTQAVKLLHQKYKERQTQCSHCPAKTQDVATVQSKPKGLNESW